MEHLTREELKGYGDRTMAANALLNADRHLAGCAVCRNELRRAVSAPALPVVVIEMSEPVHLSYEEMSAYIDAKVDEAAKGQMEEHVSICRSCAKELKDLQAFDARMALELNAAPVEKVEAAPSWFTKVREGVAAFFATPARLRLATAGVGLMLLGVFSILQVQGPGGTEHKGALAMSHITLFSAASNPHLFYGGFVVAAGGAIVLLYGLLKR
jgi:hypothetical protein